MLTNCANIVMFVVGWGVTGFWTIVVPSYSCDQQFMEMKALGLLAMLGTTHPACHIPGDSDLNNTTESTSNLCQTGWESAPSSAHKKASCRIFGKFSVDSFSPGVNVGRIWIWPTSSNLCSDYRLCESVLQYLDDKHIILDPTFD